MDSMFGEVIRREGSSFISTLFHLRIFSRNVSDSNLYHANQCLGFHEYLLNNLECTIRSKHNQFCDRPDPVATLVQTETWPFSASKLYQTEQIALDDLIGQADNEL